VQWKLIEKSFYLPKASSKAKRERERERESEREQMRVVREESERLKEISFVVFA